MIHNHRWKKLAATAFLAALTLVACSDSTSSDTTDLDALAGDYSLTVLRFDPQGSLPEQNILAALEMEEIQLTLTLDREAQIVYRDPGTQLIVTIPGSFRPTAEGIRMEWASSSQYRQLLLSRTMGYAFNDATGTLVFDGEAPDGVSRDRLLELVPAFQGEQLLDPTPGVLRVTFTRF